MRLLPAHLPDAKQMAKRLCEAFESLDLSSDWTDPDSGPPTLQQCQELMARAMGYEGWREISQLLKQPHEAVYLDGVSQSEAMKLKDRLVTNLSAGVGIDYAHGNIMNALDVAGVGYSPKMRAALEKLSTPWGVIAEEPEMIAPGIQSVSTSGHGGWILSKERLQQVPEHLRYPDGCYEEDGEYNLVAIAFPDEAQSLGVSLRDALVYLDVVCQSATQRDRIRALSEQLAASNDYREVKVEDFVEPELSEMEGRVIRYLAACVRDNRLPIRFPSSGRRNARIDPACEARAQHAFPLAEWVDLMAQIPTVNGAWSTRPGPWFDHWGWIDRDGQAMEAREKFDNALFEDFRAEQNNQ